MDLKKAGKMRVVTVQRDTSLEDAARIMRENHVGDVVVVDVKNGKKVPVGMLTDRDIVMATIALGVPAKPFSAGDVMTTDIATVTETSTLSHVIELMKERGVKRVPILSREKELTGIIAVEDIVALMAKELSALSEVSQRQKTLEFQRRRKLA